MSDDEHDTVEITLKVTVILQGSETKAHAHMRLQAKLHEIDEVVEVD